MIKKNNLSLLPLMVSMKGTDNAPCLTFNGGRRAKISSIVSGHTLPITHICSG